LKNGNYSPRQRGVDRDHARRESVDVLLADGAEVAGADEDDHLVLVAGLLDRVVDAEAGVAEVLRHATREVVVAVVELVRVEFEVANALRSIVDRNVRS
jgi:hypothetical protein